MNRLVHLRDGPKKGSKSALMLMSISIKLFGSDISKQLKSVRLKMAGM